MGLHLMSKAEKRDHIVAPPDCTGCSLCANVCAGALFLLSEAGGARDVHRAVASFSAGALRGEYESAWALKRLYPLLRL